MFAHVTRSHICIKIELNLKKEYFTPPRWPPFLCLLLQHGRRDVMSTHSIVRDYENTYKLLGTPSNKKTQASCKLSVDSSGSEHDIHN